MTYVIIFMCFIALWAVLQPFVIESDMPKGSPENRKKNYYPPEF